MSSAPIRKPLEHWRRLPIRWRVAGGSAILTFIILCFFAVAVGVMATRQIRGDFTNQVRRAADDLATHLHVAIDPETGRARCSGIDLQDYARGEQALVRVMLQAGTLLCGGDASSNPPFPPGRPQDSEGYLAEARYVPVYIGNVRQPGFAIAQYGRPLSDLHHTLARVRLLLVLGVLGGAALALLAGLAVARRAMAPIANLTAAAGEIRRTRDPGRRLGGTEGHDEVAELARTLDGMLGALDQARAETEATLSRQRRFVADASHELRTPLTSVLANLELLQEVLDGEQREAAASALRSSRRMRRLVADLLLLARADAGRIRRHEPVDVSRVVTEAAGELEPVSEGHDITVSAPAGAVVSGARDEIHRLALNLMENALRHTDPGTAVEASVERINGQVVFSVEDDGPGIPPELHDKVFERFFRGAGDRSGSSGLGLAIVRAVAESHQGTVTLEDPLDGRGARFVVRFPADSSA